jgi:hypothetical protein
MWSLQLMHSLGGTLGFREGHGTTAQAIWLASNPADQKQVRGCRQTTLTHAAEFAVSVFGFLTC